VTPRFDRRRLGLGAAGFALAPLAARIGHAAPDPALGRRIEEVATAYAADGRFTGALLALAGDEVLVRQAWGLADVAAGVPNTPETGFQIASISKTLTGALLLLLADEGLLALDDPAAGYLPGFPNLARDGVDITIRHLATHTAGVPDLLALFDVFNPASYPASATELMATIADAALRFTPGDRFEYSNSGYLLLGQIVETVTGQTYEAATRARILDPLGMDRTWIARPADPDPVAIGYLGFGPLLAPVSHMLDPAFVAAAGGWTSTIDDLRRWREALLTDAPVPGRLLDAMLAPAVPVPPPNLGSYGIGIEIREVTGERYWGHYGTTIGYRSALIHFPEHGATLILLANRGDAPMEAFVEDLTLAMQPAWG
jgi:CubicO group peptidase (beta-lactamase class C family)